MHAVAAAWLYALVVKDVTVMVKTDKLVNSNDLVIILSVMNTTPELAISARMAKRNRGKGGYLLLQRGHTAGALF